MPPATSLLYVRISQTDWYGICAVIILGSWLGWRLAYRSCRCIFRWHIMHLHRLLSSPLPRPFYQLDMATIQEGLIVVFLLTVNILPLVIRSRSWMVVHRRAANIAVMNLVPLWTGLTFGLPAHLLGVKWSTVSWMHRWIGRAVIIHSILHGAIAILSDDKPVQAIRRHYVPFMVSSKPPSTLDIHDQISKHTSLRLI